MTCTDISVDDQFSPVVVELKEEARDVEYPASPF
jgi:hypothetical protein